MQTKEYKIWMVNITARYRNNSFWPSIGDNDSIEILFNIVQWTVRTKTIMMESYILWVTKTLTEWNAYYWSITHLYDTVWMIPPWQFTFWFPKGLSCRITSCLSLILLTHARYIQPIQSLKTWCYICLADADVRLDENLMHWYQSKGTKSYPPD